MTYTRCVQSLSTGHDEDEGRMRMYVWACEWKACEWSESEQEWKECHVFCPCSSFVVLCIDCHTSPFETLILFVMNRGEREKGRANSVNACSNCSRWSWSVCLTSTETVGLLGTGAQDGHLDFYTLLSSDCSRSSVRSFRVSAHRLVGII